MHVCVCVCVCVCVYTYATNCHSVGLSYSRKTNSHSLSEDISFCYKIKVTLLCFQQPITTPYSELNEWNPSCTLHVNTTLLVFPCGLFTAKFQILYLLGKSKGLSLSVLLYWYTYWTFSIILVFVKTQFQSWLYFCHFSLMDCTVGFTFIFLTWCLK